MKETRLDKTGKKARNITAIIALVAVCAPAGWWLVKDNVQKILREMVLGEAAKECVRIPYSNHIVEPAPPGEWTTITWFDVERLSDCGAPELTGYVINGERIIHDVNLSTRGVNLPVGIQQELRYQFRVPENAHPGVAFFYVTINFPDAGRSINSPRVQFRILEPE